MQQITSATLQRNNESWVDLVFDDGSIGSCAIENPLLQPWLAEGNTPEPAPKFESVSKPTAAEKLAASGLTVAELKELLGLG